MGLRFYPKQTTLPTDHPLADKLVGLPDRFSKQKFNKDWVIEGPFLNSDDGDFSFVLSCGKPVITEVFTVSESSMIFDAERSSERVVSSIIAKCMEIEFSGATADRLMGKKLEEDMNKEDDIYVVGDYSRGTGEVEHRRVSRTDDANSPEKTGGLILPSR